MNYSIESALGIPEEAEPALYRRGHFYWIHTPMDPDQPIEVDESMRGRIIRIKINMVVTVYAGRPNEKLLRFVELGDPTLVFQEHTDIAPDRTIERRKYIISTLYRVWDS